MTRHPSILRLRAGVLSTVLVAASLMLLTVLGLMALWDADFRLFSRSAYERNQRANLESAFLLWQHVPELENFLDKDSSLLLYDSLPHSRVYFESRPWGLYEVVSVANHDRRTRALRFMGAAGAWKDAGVFYYPGRNFSFTLSGKSFLKGPVRLPKTGIQYGQFESRFFEGEKLPPGRISLSADSLPPPGEKARETVSGLLALLSTETGELLEADSLSELFYGQEPRLLRMGSGLLTQCILSGNLILLADKLHLDPSCRLENILVVAREITLREGFRGRAQLFATDSIHLGRDAVLEYPSGIFLGKTGERNRIALEAGSEVNGYVIVNGTSLKAGERPSVAHYRQDPTAIVRGLLYVKGVAQWQGLVSGAVFLDKALHISPFGRYEDFVVGATVLENRAFGYPFWLETPPQKTELAWVH